MQFFSSRRKQQESEEYESLDDSLASSDPTFTTSTRQPVGFDTVLGSGSQVNGTLRSDGNIRLDGDFTGTLEIVGNALVGENAEIKADVEARNISIAGAVRGNVKGNRVQILSTGRVVGDITARTLTTEEGAHIDGKISMMEPPEETVPVAEPEPPEEEEIGVVEAEADEVAGAEETSDEDEADDD